MKKLSVVLAAVLLFTACEKEKTNDDGIVICPPSSDTVTYKGTFERITFTGTTSADVTLKLKDGVFFGTSSVDKFPAIGTGRITNSTVDKISFRNQSVWTANFDWTLILDGTFDALKKGDSLRLSKFHGTDLFDVYRLKLSNN